MFIIKRLQALYSPLPETGEDEIQPIFFDSDACTGIDTSAWANH
jgi:hypothetical protein